MSTPSPVFVPSIQQQSVFTWIENGTGNAFVEAVAGSGKTTTLIEACSRMKGTISFVAFNKKIADEIKTRVSAIGMGERVSSGTFHSVGFSAWRRMNNGVQLNNDKDKLMCEEIGIPFKLRRAVNMTISLAKQGALFPAQFDNRSVWFDIIDHFDIEEMIEEDDKDNQNPNAEKYSVEDIINYSIKGLRWHVACASEIINFDDMIYMPVITGCKVWQSDWVLVDEAQDTNTARRMLARKMLRPGGRAIFVGDRCQAIYGFTGADNNAVDLIVKDFNCKSLPLTTTYRCPKKVVAEAQRYVSHINAHESAPDGLVEHADEETFWNNTFSKEDVILCRNTKPLVELAYNFIRRGIGCHVEGRDIGTGLVQLIMKWKRIKNVERYLDKLDEYVERQCEKMIAKGQEVKAESLRDRAECIRIIAEGCSTTDEMASKINALFQDTTGPARTLTLSTVHKSKGREFDTVYLWGQNKYMPSKYARSAWQLDQEHNLIYVAYTRAKNRLVFVSLM